MFQNLRNGNTFYVLDKNEKPQLKIGQVVSVSNPQPKYNNLSQPYMPNNMETVVDITVKIGDENIDFKQLPAALSIANFGGKGMVVSESKDAMLSEVESMLRSSNEVINSIEYHKNVVSSCDEIMQKLNPQLAKDREQEQKITLLERKMCNMEVGINDIKEILSVTLKNKGESKNGMD